MSHIKTEISEKDFRIGRGDSSEDSLFPIHPKGGGAGASFRRDFLGEQRRRFEEEVLKELDSKLKEQEKEARSAPSEKGGKENRAIPKELLLSLNSSGARPHSGEMPPFPKPRRESMQGLLNSVFEKKGPTEDTSRRGQLQGKLFEAGFPLSSEFDTESPIGKSSTNSNPMAGKEAQEGGKTSEKNPNGAFNRTFLSESASVQSHGTQKDAKSLSEQDSRQISPDPKTQETAVSAYRSPKDLRSSSERTLSGEMHKMHNTGDKNASLRKDFSFISERDKKDVFLKQQETSDSSVDSEAFPRLSLKEEGKKTKGMETSFGSIGEELEHGGGLFPSKEAMHKARDSHSSSEVGKQLQNGGERGKEAKEKGGFSSSAMMPTPSPTTLQTAPQLRTILHKMENQGGGNSLSFDSSGEEVSETLLSSTERSTDTATTSTKKISGKITETPVSLPPLKREEERPHSKQGDSFLLLPEEFRSQKAGFTEIKKSLFQKEESAFLSLGGGEFSQIREQDVASMQKAWVKLRLLEENDPTKDLPAFILAELRPLSEGNTKGSALNIPAAPSSPSEISARVQKVMETVGRHLAEVLKSESISVGGVTRLHVTLDSQAFRIPGFELSVSSNHIDVTLPAGGGAVFAHAQEFVKHLQERFPDRTIRVLEREEQEKKRESKMVKGVLAQKEGGGSSN